MNSDPDRIHPILVSVRPFVAKGDFATACEHIDHAVEQALADKRLEDAATLSSILGSFYSINGANELALPAFERAESWHSTTYITPYLQPVTFLRAELLMRQRQRPRRYCSLQVPTRT